MQLHGYRAGTPHVAINRETTWDCAAMIGHELSAKAASGAHVRGFQHLGTRDDDHVGSRRSLRRGLRSLALVPGAVLALLAQISSLSRPADRSRRLPSHCRKIVGGAAFRCAAADA